MQGGPHVTDDQGTMLSRGGLLGPTTNVHPEPHIITGIINTDHSQPAFGHSTSSKAGSVNTSATVQPKNMYKLRYKAHV